MMPGLHGQRCGPAPAGSGKGRGKMGLRGSGGCQGPGGAQLCAPQAGLHASIPTELTAPGSVPSSRGHGRHPPLAGRGTPGPGLSVGARGAGPLPLGVPAAPLGHPELRYQPDTPPPPLAHPHQPHGRDLLLPAQNEANATKMGPSLHWTTPPPPPRAVISAHCGGQPPPHPHPKTEPPPPPIEPRYLQSWSPGTMGCGWA